eukprot:GHVP01053578.1.p1 GENE.GHVP01053578.1~~GHVP01053578.1.p1  ORF type:complete len:255 (-),score=56.38 GHVP01053578.1:1-765(-)
MTNTRFKLKDAFAGAVLMAINGCSSNLKISETTEVLYSFSQGEILFVNGSKVKRSLDIPNDEDSSEEIDNGSDDFKDANGVVISDGSAQSQNYIDMVTAASVRRKRLMEDFHIQSIRDALWSIESLDKKVEAKEIHDHRYFRDFKFSTAMKNILDLSTDSLTTWIDEQIKSEAFKVEDTFKYRDYRLCLYGCQKSSYAKIAMTLDEKEKFASIAFYFDGGEGEVGFHSWSFCFILGIHPQWVELIRKYVPKEEV